MISQTNRLEQTDITFHEAGSTLCKNNAGARRVFDGLDNFGKYVLAFKANENEAILAIGGGASYHAELIREAAQDIFGEPWTTLPQHVNDSKPLEGVSIGGGLFRIDEFGEVELFEQSSVFGPLQNKGRRFHGRLANIVKREIGSVVELYRTLTEDERG